MQKVQALWRVSVRAETGLWSCEVKAYELVSKSRLILESWLVWWSFISHSRNRLQGEARECWPKRFLYDLHEKGDTTTISGSRKRHPRTKTCAEDDLYHLFSFYLDGAQLSVHIMTVNNKRTCYCQWLIPANSCSCLCRFRSWLPRFSFNHQIHS
jgi:hypothetical protein